MSWFPSPEYADWWYDLSWKGIIGFGIVAAFATAATVVFTVLQFWSDGVRDQRAEVRTVALEREASAANADAAKANAAAAGANERAARLEKEAAEVRLAYEKLRQNLAWRKIDAESAIAIAGALRASDLRPELFVTSTDPEVTSFKDVVVAIIRAATGKDPRWTTILAGHPFVGLGAQGPDETDKTKLISAFAAGGVRLEDVGHHDQLRVVIGIKPPP